MTRDYRESFRELSFQNPFDMIGRYVYVRDGYAVLFEYHPKVGDVYAVVKVDNELRNQGHINSFRYYSLSEAIEYLEDRIGEM